MNKLIKAMEDEGILYNGRIHHVTGHNRDLSMGDFEVSLGPYLNPSTGEMEFDNYVLVILDKKGKMYYNRLRDGSNERYEELIHIWNAETTLRNDLMDFIEG